MYRNHINKNFGINTKKREGGNGRYVVYKIYV
jgi:hypothetical protein